MSNEPMISKVCLWGHVISFSKRMKDTWCILSPEFDGTKFRSRRPGDLANCFIKFHCKERSLRFSSALCLSWQEDSMAKLQTMQTKSWSRFWVQPCRLCKRKWKVFWLSFDITVWWKWKPLLSNYYKHVDFIQLRGWEQSCGTLKPIIGLQWRLWQIV